MEENQNITLNLLQKKIESRLGLNAIGCRDVLLMRSSKASGLCYLHGAFSSGCFELSVQVLKHFDTLRIANKQMFKRLMLSLNKYGRFCDTPMQEGGDGLWLKMRFSLQEDLKTELIIQNLNSLNVTMGEYAGLIEPQNLIIEIDARFQNTNLLAVYPVSEENIEHGISPSIFEQINDDFSRTILIGKSLVYSCDSNTEFGFMAALTARVLYEQLQSALGISGHPMDFRELSTVSKKFSDYILLGTSALISLPHGTMQMESALADFNMLQTGKIIIIADRSSLRKFGLNTSQTNEFPAFSLEALIYHSVESTCKKKKVSLDQESFNTIYNNTLQSMEIIGKHDLDLFPGIIAHQINKWLKNEDLIVDITWLKRLQQNNQRNSIGFQHYHI